MLCGRTTLTLDLSRAGDQLARSHYEKLERKASDCIKRDRCNHRCLFRVDQVFRMESIATYFGER